MDMKLQSSKQNSRELLSLTLKTYQLVNTDSTRWTVEKKTSYRIQQINKLEKKIKVRISNFQQCRWRHWIVNGLTIEFVVRLKVWMIISLKLKKFMLSVIKLFLAYGVHSPLFPVINCTQLAENYKSSLRYSAQMASGFPLALVQVRERCTNIRLGLG